MNTFPVVDFSRVAPRLGRITPARERREGGGGGGKNGDGWSKSLIVSFFRDFGVFLSKILVFGGQLWFRFEIISIFVRKFDVLIKFSFSGKSVRRNCLKLKWLIEGIFIRYPFSIKKNHYCIHKIKLFS